MCLTTWNKHSSYVVCMSTLCFIFALSHAEYCCHESVFVHDKYTVLRSANLVRKTYFVQYPLNILLTQYFAFTTVYLKSLNGIFAERGMIHFLTLILRRIMFCIWLSRIPCLSESTLNIWPFHLLISLIRPWHRKDYSQFEKVCSCFTKQDLFQQCPDW